MILNVKISFVNGWFSYRNIKIFTDDNFCTSINANGNHSIEIPDDTKEILFQLGAIYPYKTAVSLTSIDYNEGKVFVGLSLNHRGMLLSLYDSLKSNYLQSKMLSIEEYLVFDKNINQKDLIILKNLKSSLLLFLISLIILIFSVVQQNNDLAPFAFLIGLTSLITSLVYYNEKTVERNTYKVRIISSVMLFVLSIYFLDNSYLFLHWIILIFTILLVFFFIENLRNNENTNLKDA
ncbi:hypothetical protein SAMN05421741_10941 [Paenimyroides ummariense]|uniref:Uncharacterized protein n=1 Tax=Paenimyroides ummariense TaxID=913024 RepID=A0A1I5B2S0_9FLAO|nr:hypothetical protein [Paenimyroides ummariense]SFN69016.1 hypothetical protein SAMN05421741_10941 [Paenimyroides ummariense]